jgi:RAB protein geranylgeranyltransferase component A
VHLRSALAKAGFTVAHLDRAAYYGAGQASLTPAELIAWADAHTASDAYTWIACSRDLPPRAAQYVLSLAPAVVPAVGTLIGGLIRSGVARYGEYKLVERTGIYVSGGTVRVVPGGKEDVFRSKDLSLLDKRRLMRFLLFAAGEFEGAPELAGKQDTPFLAFLRDAFSLPEQVAETIAFALAFRVSADGP